jgi:Mor family transcriptional regulator
MHSNEKRSLSNLISGSTKKKDSLTAQEYSYKKTPKPIQNLKKIKNKNYKFLENSILRKELEFVAKFIEAKKTDEQNECDILQKAYDNSFIGKLNLIKFKKKQEIVDFYTSMSNEDFIDLIEDVYFLKEYIDKLPNKYYSYVFLEIIYYINNLHEKNLLKAVYEKPINLNKYKNAIKTLDDISFIFSEKEKDSILELAIAINNYDKMKISEFNQIVKESVKKKLLEVGLLDKDAEKIYQIINQNYNNKETQHDVLKKTTKRNKEIYSLYKDGNSVIELAKKFKLTRPAIYNIIDDLNGINITSYKAKPKGRQKILNDTSDLKRIKNIFKKYHKDMIYMCIAYNGVSGHPCRLSSDSLRRDIFCNSILA